MRMIVEELGVGANPNEIAKALHNWFDNVPENPRDDLWREVHYLLYEAGYDPPDVHERRADAYRAVQLRLASEPQHRHVH